MLKSILLVALALSLAVGGGAGSVWLTAISGDSPSSAVGWLAAGDLQNRYPHPGKAEQFGLPFYRTEGVEFHLLRSADGAFLDGRCSYRIAGSIPPARFWALAERGLDVTAGRGLPLLSPSTLENEKGEIEIMASRHPFPGNWLSLTSNGPFALVLTLFDTPLTGVSLANSALPTVTVAGCDG